MIIDGHHHVEDNYDPILRRMDALGVDKTVLVGVGVSDLGVVTVCDSLVFKSCFLTRTLGTWKARRLVNSPVLQNVLLGDPRNDTVLRAITDHPDRFLGFCFVNPESPRAMDEIERCLDAGMCGIKLALLQYPTDLRGQRMRAICEAARARRVPIFFHQGLTKASSDPEDMLRTFPDVTFIIAHAGVQYFREAVELARRCANVLVDTSSYFVTEKKIRILLEKLGADRIVMGSDVPVMCEDQADALAKIRNLQLPAEAERAILGENLRAVINGAQR